MLLGLHGSCMVRKDWNRALVYVTYTYVCIYIYIHNYVYMYVYVYTEIYACADTFIGTM